MFQDKERSGNNTKGSGKDLQWNRNYQVSCGIQLDDRIDFKSKLMARVGNQEITLMVAEIFEKQRQVYNADLDLVIYGWGTGSQLSSTFWLSKNSLAMVRITNEFVNVVRWNSQFPLPLLSQWDPKEFWLTSTVTIQPNSGIHKFVCKYDYSCWTGNTLTVKFMSDNPLHPDIRFRWVYIRLERNGRHFLCIYGHQNNTQSKLVIFLPGGFEKPTYFRA